MKKSGSERNKNSKTAKAEATVTEQNTPQQESDGVFQTPQGEMLNQLGELYLKKENYEKAIENFVHAVLVARETWDSVGEGIAQFNTARTWQYSSRHDRALPNFFFALDNFITTGVKYYQILCYCGIADSFLAQGNIEASTENAVQAREIAGTSIFVPVERERVDETVGAIFECLEEAAKVLSGNDDTTDEIKENLLLEFKKTMQMKISRRMDRDLHGYNEQEILRLEQETMAVKNDAYNEVSRKTQKQNQIVTVADVIAPGESPGEDKNAVWQAYLEELEWLNPNFMKRFPNVYPTLTRREIRICSMLAIQISNKNIAAMLNIEKKVVDKHRQNIRKKMNIPSSGDLAMHIALFRE